MPRKAKKRMMAVAASIMAERKEMKAARPVRMCGYEKGLG